MISIVSISKSVNILQSKEKKYDSRISFSFNKKEKEKKVNNMKLSFINSEIQNIEKI